MRRGVRGDAAHRATCHDCRQVGMRRYLARRRHAGLSPAEARITEMVWARLTDREVFAYKARAALMGEIPRPLSP